MIIDDAELVRIRRKVVTIKVFNILDDNVELKVTVDHYNAFISQINIGLVFLLQK